MFVGNCHIQWWRELKHNLFDYKMEKWSVKTSQSLWLTQYVSVYGDVYLCGGDMADVFSW